ncbi:GTP pyrophosphokinase [Paenibacillus sacheonensis]|uniref:GTP pyrophosphokinase family protein n=1 Tax=Paenibacillus sacheonensis TaxID=742054 RepID=A0A7X4YJN0_9BACL|nr:GTP pyrophosphokinase family protein [Paenibacillus sacheonensis]MBM7564157.1 putative GTP pyrophosphokinase [Paenibacillus sacheonensis]NBC67513.1 GTP pyrophosphokinase family protein [Paenibacillus sacheonensis]
MMDKQMVMEWAKMLMSYKFALDEVSTKLTILNEELQFIQNYNPIEHVKTRIKSPEGIVEKLQRKGLEVSKENAAEHIRDIAGVRVICSFTTDVYRVYDMIRSQGDVEVIELKDYIKHPKPNGYQSLHLIIQIPIFLSDRTEHVKVEIQLRTIAMDFWASLEHKIYYQFHDDMPESIREQLKSTADMINMLDRRMLRLKEEVQKFSDEVEVGKQPALQMPMLPSSK